MQTASVKTIKTAIDNASNPWDAFICAVHATIDAAANPDVRRILFTEREAVLSPTEWDQLSSDTGFWAMEAELENAMDQGYMERRPVHALHAVISMSISRITAIAAYTALSIEEVHTEFDDWLERYRIKKG